MLIFAALAAGVQANCFFEYVSSIGESCFFGSDNSRLSMAVAYDVFVEGCDFETCSCATPVINPTSCDKFIVKTMFEFMGLHPPKSAPEQSLYRNVTNVLKEICDKVGPGQENEASQAQLAGSHGACASASKPPTGWSAAITIYVTVISLLFTFTFFGELDYVGKGETVSFGEYRPVGSTSNAFSTLQA